jgi:TetR/AcrR family transcriptional regulator
LTKKRPAKKTPSAPRAASKAAGTKRQIGRPDSTDESVGPEALITKTCELLAIYPPSKVTRAEVARYAGVDPSLIRYYFRNRTSLLVASAEKLKVEFDATFEHGLQRVESSAAGKLQARMGALLDLIVSHPFYHRLLTEELFTSDDPAAINLLEKLTKQGVAAYENILAEGEEEGTLRNTNAAFLFIALIGLCEAYVTLAPILDIALGKTVAKHARRRQYEEFVAEFLLHGMSPVRKPAKGK